MRLALPTRYLRILLLSIVGSIFLLVQSLVYSAGGSFIVNDGDSGENFNFFAPSSSTGGIFTSQRIVGDTLSDCPTGTNISPTATGYSIQYYVGGNLCFNTTITIYWTDNIGKNGATGATGSTGSTGNSAYEIAQSFGFTGTVTEWLNALKGETGEVGATGTTQIVFSTGQIFSGATFTLDQSSDNATLNSGSTYIPAVSKIDGTYYLNYEGLRNIIIVILLFFGTLYFIYNYSKGDKKLF